MPSRAPESWDCSDRVGPLTSRRTGVFSRRDAPTPAATPRSSGAGRICSVDGGLPCTSGVIDTSNSRCDGDTWSAKGSC